MTMVDNNDFDWWRKDVFFSAAEEVQNSSDSLESVSRAWEREGRDGFPNFDPDGLLRELHTCLGTTKWQLEEFEKSVKLSYHNSSLENNYVARHRQFVVAIRSQISRIEKSIIDTLAKDGKQPFRWVHLDEDEREDLTLFLSAPSLASNDSPKALNRIALTNKVDEHVSGKNSQVLDTIGDEDVTCHLELERQVLPFAERATFCSGESSNGHRELAGSSEVGEWRILIEDDETANKSLEVSRVRPPYRLDFWGALKNIERSAKLRWFRLSFRKLKEEEHLNERLVPKYSNTQGLIPISTGCYHKDGSRGWHKIRHYCRRVGAFQRHVQCSQSCIKFSRPIQVAMIFTLMIMFMAPFLVYS